MHGNFQPLPFVIYYAISIMLGLYHQTTYHLMWGLDLKVLEWGLGMLAIKLARTQHEFLSFSHE
jgi:hypothetical protein